MLQVAWRIMAVEVHKDSFQVSVKGIRVLDLDLVYYFHKENHKMPILRKLQEFWK